MLKKSMSQKKAKSIILIWMFIFKKLTSFNQFIDSFITCFVSLEAERIDFLVRDAVISFVLVLADIGKVKVIVDSFLDVEGDIFLAVIVDVVAYVKDLVRHFVMVLNGKEDSTANILDMDKSPLVMFLEENEKPVHVSLIDEVVNEEVEPHARRNPEGSGEPKAY